jgi:hypothetical protein
VQPQSPSKPELYAMLRRAVVVNLAGVAMTNSGGRVDEAQALRRCRRVVAMAVSPWTIP